MTATDDVKGYLLKADEGPSIWTLGTLMTFKATSATTDGQFTLINELASSRTKPPLHIHHREDECCFVLEGEIVFQVGDERFDASSGDFVFMPRETPHAFAVRSEFVRVLALFVPGGLEDLFHAVGEPARELSLPPAGARLTDAQLDERRALSNTYGIEIIGPSLRL